MACRICGKSGFRSCNGEGCGECKEGECEIEQQEKESHDQRP
jgi:hypothetical protein